MYTKRVEVDSSRRWCDGKEIRKSRWVGGIYILGGSAKGSNAQR